MQPLSKKPPEQKGSQARALALLREGVPLLDVRAPEEFDQGAVPNSANVPILDDEERKRVGTTYKHSGHDAAVALGHKLVSGATRASRIAAWRTFIEQHPGAMVMCWRGGQRSQIAEHWLTEAGCRVQRVPGGYKALRRACIDTLEAAPAENKDWWVVAGRTGVQKTVLIHRLATSIDLEGLAHHRGSAFGAYVTPQPTPATFENMLAVAYLQHHHDQLVLEDESRTIGRLALPAGWHQRMQASPLVQLEADLDARVDHIVREYVTEALAAGEPAQDLEARYRDSLRRISRRLGGALHQQIDSLVAEAFAGQTSHEAWVHALLSGYYDPMYDYQLSRKESRIRFRGNMDEVEAFLAAQGAGTAQ